MLRNWTIDIMSIKGTSDYLMQIDTCSEFEEGQYLDVRLPTSPILFWAILKMGQKYNK